ncbi:MAG: DUF4380 domain-containing protein [Victivallales bacterium]|jgi:hypothetical protein|nr:DUF4380 domain-containing protein [Victivallales bacterium]
MSDAKNHETAVKLEAVNYRNWDNCLRLSNGTVELVVSVGLGPRILCYRRIDGGVNFMKNFTGQMEKISTDEWFSYGGHRLWHAPEISPRTYYPDVDPVEYSFDGKTIALKCAKEATTGLRKEIDIELSPSGTEVTLRQRIFNENLWAVTFAPWGLTVMAEGGELFVPQEPYVPHGSGAGESFVYARPLVLWQFTKMSDPRFTWGDDFIRMRQDNRYDSKQKFGATVKAGWAAYALSGELFVKHFPYDPEATYPDGGCNAEFFTMPGFLEVESLGALSSVEPGDCAQLDERWELPNQAQAKKIIQGYL